jgi:hypothetical protein
MKKTNRYAFVLVLSFVLFSITWIDEARAMTSDRLTTFSVNQPLRIPGVVLPPGEYALQLVNLGGSRNLVRVTDTAHSKVYATFFGVPEMLLAPAEEARLVVRETNKGEIPELKAWYYPGSTDGLSFMPVTKNANLIAQSN